jgi:hypothetical protein
MHAAQTYRTRPTTPYQLGKRQPFEIPREGKHPVRDEIRKNIGQHVFTATFEEDTQTIALFKHIPGLVAFVCTLKKGEAVIGQGRGTAVFNKTNRFIERTVRTAMNSSLIDAVVRSKVMDSFQPDMAAQTFTEPITEKQKSYLLELVQIHVPDEKERERWRSEVGELTKEEASKAIQGFAG